MKFTLSIAITLTVNTCLYAQVQFAGASFESSFAINSNNKFSLLKTFPKSEFPRFESMKLGPDGKVYFTTSNTVGVIDASGSNRRLLVTVPSTYIGEICFGLDGKIYLTTYENKLYRIEPDGSGMVELGTVPFTFRLITGSNNLLFGVSEESPSKLFKVRTDGSDYTVLRTMNTFTEGGGGCRLLLAPDNRLYGNFQSMAANNSGTFFRVDTTGNNFIILYSGVAETDAKRPSSAPVYLNGKVYLATESGGNYGGGAILVADTSSTTAQKLFDFGDPGSAAIGKQCISGLVAGPANKLYGATMNQGTVFSINQDGSMPTVLFTTVPSSIYYNSFFQINSVLLDDGITLMVQSNTGGFNYGGYLCAVKTDGSGSQVVYDHVYAPNGHSPTKGIIKDGQNNLYGVMQAGGTGGAGVVYKHSVNGGGFQILHHFTGNQARNPLGRPTLATDGKLYGVCLNGGNSANLSRGGAIYRLNPDGTAYEVIREFNPASGPVFSPYGDLVEGSSGELYGIASGVYPAQNAVSIYKINKDGTGFSVLRSLDSASEGVGVCQNLVVSGNYVYGTCAGGGSNGVGTAFRIRTDGTGFQVLKTFTVLSPDGYNPYTGLSLANNGRLYGFTFYGGSFGYGTMFSMNTNGSGFVKHRDLGLTNDGVFPMNPPVQASDGNLYGNMGFGGANFNGTFYKYEIAINSFTIIRHFQAGERPSDGPLVEIPFSSTLPVSLLDFQAIHVDPDKSVIRWSTEKEVNLQKFVVEKSFNGKDFKELAVVFPSNSNEPIHKYEAIDLTPGKSKVYYRLRMVDNDNSFKVSSIRFLDFSSNLTRITIYPNPTYGYITIDNEFKGTVVSISIVDNMGRLVYNKSVPRSNNISIDISLLAKGTYHITASDGREKAQSIFVKE